MAIHWIQGIAQIKFKIIDYNSIFSYKLPEIKVTDFFTSLLKMANLIVEGENGTTFNIMPYDDWIKFRSC